MPGYNHFVLVLQPFASLCVHFYDLSQNSKQKDGAISDHSKKYYFHSSVSVSPGDSFFILTFLFSCVIIVQNNGFHCDIFIHMDNIL
jgi:hypothetical protein